MNRATLISIGIRKAKKNSLNLSRLLVPTTVSLEIDVKFPHEEEFVPLFSKIEQLTVGVSMASSESFSAFSRMFLAANFSFSLSLALLWTKMTRPSAIGDGVRNNKLHRSQRWNNGRRRELRNIANSKRVQATRLDGSSAEIEMASGDGAEDLLGRLV